MGAPLPVAACPSFSPTLVAADAAAQSDWFRRIRDAAAAPGGDSGRVIAQAQEALCELDPEAVTAEGVEALLLIAQHHYNSVNAQAGVGPASHALLASRRLGQPSLIRRAATFCGVMNSETGNLPAAVACYAEALDLAKTLADATGEAAVWNNLGLALQYAGQYADAVRCYDQALRQPVEGAARLIVLAAALANTAQACLRVHDLRQGISAAKRVIGLLAEPQDPTLCTYRVSAESYLAELLLEVEDVDGAREHVGLAKRFAELARQPRAHFRASLAEGQVEVRAGLADIGLTRLKNELSRSRGGPKEFLRDALTAAVKGYEQAGQPDVAIVYLQELLNLNRDARQQQVLMHHERHLRQVERSRISVELQHAADGELDSRRSSSRASPCWSSSRSLPSCTTTPPANTATASGACRRSSRANTASRTTCAS